MLTGFGREGRPFAGQSANAGFESPKPASHAADGPEQAGRSAPGEKRFNEVAAQKGQKFPRQNMKNLYKNSQGVIARREVLMALTKVSEASVYSSYRTLAEQKILFDNGKSKTLFSTHRRGLACDVANWQAVEKKLNEAGLINDIDWDKNHFAWGGESEAARYPIIDNPRIVQFYPNPKKVKFIISKNLPKEKIIKHICKVCSFYAERGFDLDWTLEQIDRPLPYFEEWSGVKWIAWPYLMPYAEKGAITCWIYDAGKETRLINNTGKFKDCAIVQIPMSDFLLGHKLFDDLYGDYPVAVLVHEFAHATHWLLTNSLEADKMDEKVSKGETEKEKVEIVGKELEKLFLIYVEKRILPTLTEAIRQLRIRILGK